MAPRQIVIAHGVSFAVAVILVCALPAYSLTHLPLAMTVGTICEVAVILASAAGVGIWIVKLIQEVNSYRRSSARLGSATMQLVLTIVFLLLCLGRILWRPSPTAIVLVMTFVAAIGLGGGAWMSGRLLKWLWRVTSPSTRLHQGSKTARGGECATSRS